MNEAVASMMDTSTIAGEIAIFAGGCFWSVESSIEKIQGVLSVGLYRRAIL